MNGKMESMEAISKNKQAESVSGTAQRSAVWVVVGICLLVYLNSLGNGFVNFDDPDARILSNPFLTAEWHWGHVVTAFTQATAGYYDPVYVLSYVIDFKLWGMNPAGFHLDNVLLHTANSVWVLVLLLRLTGRLPLAFLAALLFAVHPLHVESVSWATSRKDVFSQFLALAAFWVYLKGRSGDLARFVAYGAGSIFFLLLAMMVKPTVVILPAVLLVTEILLIGAPFHWKRLLGFQAVSLAVLVAFVVLTLPMTVGIAVKPEIQFAPATHVSLFLNLYAYFVKLVLLPLNLSAFYLIAVPENPGALEFLLWLALFLSALGWVGRGLCRSVREVTEAKRPDCIAWGVAVFGIGLLPFTNLLPRTIYLADRYTYFASIGFCVFAAALLLKIPPKPLRVSVAGVVVLLYAALCVDRIAVWKDSPTLWADIDSKRTISASDHHRTMGAAHAFEGQWEQALAAYERAGLKNIQDPEERLKIANIYYTAGRLPESEKVILATLAKNPDHLPAVERLIVLNIMTQRFREAENHLLVYGANFTGPQKTLFSNLIGFAKFGDKEAAARTYRQLQRSIGSRPPHV